MRTPRDCDPRGFPLVFALSLACVPVCRCGMSVFFGPRCPVGCGGGVSRVPRKKKEEGIRTLLAAFTSVTDALSRPEAT